MKSLIDKINNEYGINVGYDYEKIDGGYLTDNYALSDGHNKYFLKKYRFSEESRLRPVHQVKIFFSSHHIPIIMPLKTKTGQTYFSYEKKYYALFPFIEGKIITRDQLSEKAARSLAGLLGKIHLASKDNLPLFELKTRNGWKMDKFRQEAAFFQDLIKQKEPGKFERAATEYIAIRQKFTQKWLAENIKLNCGPNHLLHGDYHTYNVFYDTNEAISHVYDLEKAAMGPRVLELVRVIDFDAFNGEFTEATYKMAKIIFDSYQAVYPLSRQEWENGWQSYYYDYFTNVWIVRTHYIENNERPDIFLYDNLKKDHYLLDKFDAHLEILSKFFD